MKYLAMLVVVVACGCEGGNAPRSEVANKAAANIVYTKDARTGLCFGSIESTSYAGYSVISITNVPCSAVEKYIKGRP